MRTYKFKLYRTKKSWKLDRQVRIAAAIWNRCLSIHKRYYSITGKYLNVNRLKNQVTKMKKRPEFAQWRELGSQSVQDAVERLDRGFKSFFRKDAKRPPKFKSFRKFSSFTMKQAGWGFVGDNEIRIGNETYKYHKSRDVLGKPKTVTVKRNPLGEWFIFVVCDDSGIENEKYPKTGRSAGFDFGLKDFLTVNDGRKIRSPEFLQKVEWLCHKRGKSFIKIGKWEPTSKTCSSCGWKNDSLSLSDRVWECGGCGAVHDRDVNAAVNIFELGYQLTEEGASVTALSCNS